MRNATHCDGVSIYEAKMKSREAVVLIKNGKKAGSAKWDAHHGLYAICGGFSTKVIASLETGLRNRPKEI
ncbi:MAG: hypothetical protein V3S71_02740 [Acidobacteriota bacterium]